MSRKPASLNRHLLWLLAGVVGVSLAGLALTLWVGWRASEAELDRVLRRDATQIAASVRRNLDYYERLADNIAHDPALPDLLAFGAPEEQQAWAASRRQLIPDLLGLALTAPEGEVLGDPDALRVGPQCRRELARGGADLLVHREMAGAEHIDFVADVRDFAGNRLGRVFLSVRLGELARTLADAGPENGAARLLDADGEVIVARSSEADTPHRHTQAVPGTPWTLELAAPSAPLWTPERVSLPLALGTLSALLVWLGFGLWRLRRGMFDGFAAVRDGLAATLAGTQASRIEPRYREFADAVGEIAAIANALDAQRAQLAHQSLTDSLTGLPNRRALEVQFPRIQADAARHGRSVALLLLDIDHFKSINDRHGHAAGDQTLVALGVALRALTRQADFCARLAGDEFVAILVNTDEAGVRVWFARLIERFRNACETAGLQDTTGLSGGYTWIGRSAEEGLAQALAHADRALYAAKGAGRGRLAGDAERSA